MGSVIVAAEVLLITIGIIAVLAVAWLWLRRRWLSRTGGTFACSLRHDISTPGSRWVLGVARYRQQELQWFPSFSPWLWPTRRFDRAQVHAGVQRRPSANEAELLYEGQRILRLDGPMGGVELAMDAGPLTGLLSWLEAAPPGMRYRNSPASPD